MNGSITHFLRFLFMFLIAHQSIASDNSNSKKDKSAIELNVNIYINGSKTKEIAPGNLLFDTSYNEVHYLVYYSNWYDIK